MTHKNEAERKKYAREWYLNNKDNKRKTYKKQALIRYRRNKVLLVDYKGGKCVKCGYNKCIKALEFHHTSDDKEGHISTMINQGYGIEKLKIEADKCDLVCANCHREIHY